MDATNNLRNIAGYRAKSINALNSAVIQNRIIGGDVSPIVSANGTTLRIAQSNNIKRFELYSGIANTDGELYTTMCVSDGALYDNFNLKTLKNVVNTQYTSTGIMPRSSGWYCKGTHPSQWETCTVEILRYQGEYYIAFHFNGQLYSELIEGAQDADVELVVVIGVFHNEGEIAQYITGDIYISRDVAVNQKAPWTIELVNNEWCVVRPRWTLSAPYPDGFYPEGATAPVPAKSVDSIFEDLTPIVVNNVAYYKVTDVTIASTGSPTGGKPRRAYACINNAGEYGLLVAYDTSAEIRNTPACIRLGTWLYDENDTIIGFDQEVAGAITSSWTETPKYYVIENTRYTEAPIGRAEGSSIYSYSYWKMRTAISNIVYESEYLQPCLALPHTYPQIALRYDTYVYRYEMFYSNGAMMCNNFTTPVKASNYSIFGQFVYTPFVERVQVVYPDSPLKQGKVEAVGAGARVLVMDGTWAESTTTLFNTECIDSQVGNVIEVDQ